MQWRTGVERQAQLPAIIAEESAQTGLHGRSAETIVRRTGIS